MIIIIGSGFALEENLSISQEQDEGGCHSGCARGGKVDPDVAESGVSDLGSAGDSGNEEAEGDSRVEDSSGHVTKEIDSNHVGAGNSVSVVVRLVLGGVNVVGSKGDEANHDGVESLKVHDTSDVAGGRNSTVRNNGALARSFDNGSEDGFGGPSIHLVADNDSEETSNELAEK